LPNGFRVSGHLITELQESLMIDVLRMSDVDLAGKRVLIREDLNVPMADGVVTSDKRLRAAIPTIRSALDAGAQVMIMSHLGRPTEGQYDEQLSLAPVAARMSELLGASVPLYKDWLDGVETENGRAVLLENVRFNVGEESDDEDLSRRMAKLCDVFVMDAFGTAHRAQASTHGVARFASVACAGPLLEAELDALTRAMTDPARPVVAVVGGSKVSGKLKALNLLCARFDKVIVGGGIANTFIAAAGYDVGESLFEVDLLEEAARLMTLADIPLPVDVVVGDEFSAHAKATVRPVDGVMNLEMIMDVGPETAGTYAGIMKDAGTIIWNGPVGVFEFEKFENGTRALAQAIAASSAFSLAGGGDTLAAIDKYGIADDISYVSTGGGAFLKFLEGKTLPAVAVLEERARQM